MQHASAHPYAGSRARRDISPGTGAVAARPPRADPLAGPQLQDVWSRQFLSRRGSRGNSAGLSAEKRECETHLVPIAGWKRRAPADVVQAHGFQRADQWAGSAWREGVAVQASEMRGGMGRGVRRRVVAVGCGREGGRMGRRALLVIPEGPAAGAPSNGAVVDHDLSALHCRLRSAVGQTSRTARARARVDGPIRGLAGESPARKIGAGAAELLGPRTDYSGIGTGMGGVSASSSSLSQRRCIWSRTLTRARRCARITHGAPCACRRHPPAATQLDPTQRCDDPLHLVA
jgi:hypothetical protein